MIKRIALFACLSFCCANLEAATAAPAAKAPDALQTCLEKADGVTPSVNACLTAESGRRGQILDQYRGAALKKIGHDRTAAASFNKAQTAWLAYRQAYCSAIFDYWRDGTIRTGQQIYCQLDLTAERTHQIWKDYLTYPDGTPPELPEPPPAP